MKKLLCLLILFITAFSSWVHAEETALLGEVSDLAKKREIIQQNIEEIEKDLDLKKNSFSKDSLDLVRQKLDLYKQIDLTLGQHLVIEKQIESNKNSKKDLNLDKSRLIEKGLTDSPPYNFFYLDKVKDELAQVQMDADELAGEELNIKDQIKLAQAALGEKEKKRRKIKDENGGVVDRDLSLSEDLKLDVAGLDSELAREWLALKTSELDFNRSAQELSKSRLAIENKKLTLVLSQTVFSSEDLKERITRIEKLESDFALELETVRKQVLELNSKLLSVNQQEPILSESQTNVVKLKREVLEKKYDLITDKLRRSPLFREIWTRRYLVFNHGATRTDLRNWRRESGDYLTQLDREYIQVADALGDLRRKIASLDKQGESFVSYENLSSILEDSLSSIETSRKMHRKLMGEIDDVLDETNVKNFIKDGWYLVYGFLDLEIISVDDRPITVGKIFFALVLLIAGFSLSRRLSRLAGHKILHRMHMHDGPRQAVETLIYYALVVIMTLFALYVANVPLTLFTVLGGALAIGVGFGSQNILNNFISSLIIMVEQPIRIGDLIEVDQTSGRVQKIGARCTQIRTFNNIDILIPNSFFLEKNVINRTLSDDLIRTQISVGVAYGSDTKKVERLLLQVTQEHELVLDKPEPVALFSNFGESALEFKVTFWIQLVSEQNRLKLESDLRHMMIELFIKNGINIAFPQRDVNLNMIKPIEIEIKK